MSIGANTAIRITLTGRVQGIGVRPAIARLARQLSLTGWVGNTWQGVEIVAEGSADNVEQFARELPHQLPKAAVIESRLCASVSPPNSALFEIRRATESGVIGTRVPQDRSACEECLEETRSDSGRRSGYPFTSCTACGPRFSIVDSMPYERDRTSMKQFVLCADCEKEYKSPDDRRFHAETNACPACGPNWWSRDKSGRLVAARGNAIRAAAAAIREGKIVALQGLGGYQLIVDATSEAAVNRLRGRKRRFGKPFAVMVGSIAQASRLAKLDDAESKAILSPGGPIVVLRRSETTDIAHSVAPGLDTLGLMLPTTPMHAMLLAACQRPLVVTSGNREGDPLEFEHEGAGKRLAEIADLWLEHDRPICRPIDDSVVRVIAGRVAALRLARGIAPLALDIPSSIPLLAVGGHQKSAIALCNGQQSVLGPHVGDLDSVAERDRWETELGRILRLYGCESPSILAGDAHPEYASTRWAVEQRQHFISVQHHHAHIVAGMVEHGLLDHAVLGVAFDGTGLGDDKTVWGGEFLMASATGFRRVGHLLPFELLGGEQAIREPWRLAVSLVERAAGIERASSLKFHSGASISLLPLIGNKSFSSATTSAGRLFDGIAALVLGVELSQFEGHGPMLLEAICDRSAVGCYRLLVSETMPFALDWRPAILQVLADLRLRIAPGVIAMRFHRGLAQGVFEATLRYPQVPIVLSGGCFQNRLLVELLLESLEMSGRIVATPGMIPVNDGGLAAGQLAVASAQLSGRTGR